MKVALPQMSFSIPIAALLLYPFLYPLPLNPARFRWGFEQGLAPMPPEAQEKAEAADRVVLCVTHIILLVVVVLLMHGSPISAYEVGLTTDNWKPALGMGIPFSLFPLGLGELLLLNMPPEKVREEPESRGPLVAWYGLNTLGSFTHEFWRAFCIVSLIRLGLSAWVAILIVAVVYGTLHLQTSVAWALGSATFGGAAGFLFVNTGSLLSPLTMGLITAGAHLYQVRQASSSIERIGTNKGIRHPESRGLGEKLLTKLCHYSGRISLTLTRNPPESNHLLVKHTVSILEYAVKSAGLRQWLRAKMTSIVVSTSTGLPSKRVGV